MQRLPSRTLPSWVSRRNTLLTIAAASVAPAFYFWFIGRNAVNSFYADDWSVVPFVHSALHGQLSLSQLWAQHTESRFVIGKFVDALFGFADHLDLRWVIIFSGAVFTVTYASLLFLVRKYLGKSLTPLVVLVIGATWFSVADVENSLWAFQVSWYLTVFFTVVMLCALLLPESRRTLWFVVALVLAIAASLSTVQGFLSWPIGAAWILWQPQSRRTRRELAAWICGALLTVAAYLPGYTFSAGNTCIPANQCTSTFELHHPLAVLGFFFTLLGNVIPGDASDNHLLFVIVGVVLFATALFILVQSWRLRASSERLPLPALLIVFGLLFDLTITFGRGGTGPTGALVGNRFVMANLILVTGVLIYGLAHIPRRAAPVTSGRLRTLGRYVAILAVAMFVVIQVTVSTHFGLTHGPSTRELRTGLARYYVNVYRSCQGVPILRVPEPIARDAAEDQLGEYGPTAFRFFRELGPTPVLVQTFRAAHEPHCLRPPVTSTSP